MIKITITADDVEELRAVQLILSRQNEIMAERCGPPCTYSQTRSGRVQMVYSAKRKKGKYKKWQPVY